MKKNAALGFLFFLSISVYSQDYLINFDATGDNTSFEGVKVENLTQGTSLTVNGTDILNLKAVLTGINGVYSTSEKGLEVYPNPVTEFTTIEFVATAPGDALIAIYDQVGKTIVQIGTSLAKGTHAYQINGLSSGFYTVRVTSETYSYTGKILSQLKGTALAGITCKSFYEDNKNEGELKSANSTIQMQYTAGDRLKFTGISGNYSTIVTDIPTESKTIPFDFIACTDGDNNNYPVVKIGTQVWMGENLKATKYNTGSDIPIVTDAAEWTGLSSPAYCWYDNDEATYKNTYGALYNWHTVNTGNLCPTGWHVPADTEWTILENYLIANGYNYDGTTTENKIAKALASASGWNSSSEEGAVGNADYSAKRNATGYTALPGGYRGNGGAFFSVGNYGGWWSSTENDVSGAFSLGLGFGYNGVNRDEDSKKDGFSVRCVMDGNGSAPVAAFTSSNTNISEGESVAFTDQSTNSPTSWIWDFGDGGTSTQQNPSHTFSTVGTFTVGLTATNSYGGGSETKANYVTVTTGGGNVTVTDYEGNVYNTIVIGTQEWMAENLKATKYNTGSDIPNVTDATEWSALTTPAYCWYNNDEAANKSTYGALYNWHTVNTGNLCPTDWHVPDDDDWTQLTDYLGGESAAGGKLKETGTTHWVTPNTGATNETGFTALPGGYRDYYYGGSNNIGYFGLWWSSSENAASDAWGRDSRYNGGGMLRSQYSKLNGFSVRCVRD